MTDHHRRSIRLRDYDYTLDGAYLVTICAHERMPLFGHVADGAIALNTWGCIVVEEWDRTAIVRPGVALDAFIVMPNHVHGVIVIVDAGNEPERVSHDTHHMISNVGATRRDAPTSPTLQSGSLGAIIGQLKSMVTKRINRLPDAPDHPVWQRNYYAHIIRSQEALNQIRAYIANNPAQWAQDSLFLGGQ
jgi:putative transposase